MASIETDYLLDDTNIIDLFWSRNEDAIRETDLKYGKLCRNIANNILSLPEDANECVNDAYLGVWNAIPQERPNIFSAFLCRIVRNLSIKRYEYIHAQKRNPGVVMSLEELYECISAEPEEDSIEAGLADDVLKDAINRFLESLSEDARNVFIRRYWFFDPIKEISRKYKMSISKVDSILVRTRKKLKQFLINEGFQTC